MNHRRTAGLGLLVYGIGTVVSFATIGVPGGAYEPVKVAAYLAQGHALSTFIIAYLGLFAALGLLAFGQGIRAELGTWGDTAWALSVAALALAVVGWFVGAGVVVATAEGGPAISAGIPLPVAHTIGEIAGLLAGCAPAFCIGVVALLMTRTSLPGWLRAFTAVAGVCGILAPLYFTFFVYLLWTLVCGAALARSRTPAESSTPALRMPA
jgi:hypothetical protein